MRAELPVWDAVRDTAMLGVKQSMEPPLHYIGSFNLVKLTLREALTASLLVPIAYFSA